MHSLPPVVDDTSVANALLKPLLAQLCCRLPTVVDEGLTCVTGLRLRSPVSLHRDRLAGESLCLKPR